MNLRIRFLRSGSFRLLLILLVAISITVFMQRMRSVHRQSRAEFNAVFVAEREFKLDNLERLGDGKVDEGIQNILTGLKLPEKLQSQMKSTFFSPFQIRESFVEDSFATTPVKIDNLKAIVASFPDFDGFVSSLTLHLNKPELAFNGSFPASDTIFFSKAPISFAELYDEALVWYFVGRHLAEQGKGQQTFRIFLGIIDLALVFENNRLCHPDKERRLLSCQIREIAAVGLVESAALLFKDKEELLAGMQDLERRLSGFIGIEQILAFDKKLPVEFGQQLAREVSAGIAQTKYHNGMTRLASIFGNKAALLKTLDTLYDPLIKVASMPYSLAQKEFNSWNRKYAEVFAEHSEDSDIGVLKAIFYVDSFLEQGMLYSFTSNLPFYLLTDVKTMQILEGAKAAIILNVYYKTQREWPDSLTRLEEWLQKPLPQDIIKNIPLQFKTGNPPRVAGTGRDGRPDTADDLVFVPFGQKARE